ncbi:hypothetical protein BS50DRAFT_644166 [Corynespora cassiicola Philippines]|uniref:Telomeric single stranded DNA binding POT1/Cdc13 domain-containing protein n=1 Tax=Corynespora cassiicola Philippines TaxID=1448308 RepID=A0A2T2PCR3_CORCC|nr:hypothetical protein BS50DRAFT_644166 [Corynespora cassiicola Philippines]
MTEDPPKLTTTTAPTVHNDPRHQRPSRLSDRHDKIAGPLQLGGNYNMENVPIAELSPNLRDPASKQFKAEVTLIWPYSSVAREFALLLAEPDLRLRRRKGQVRVRFTGSSAKAIATTGVGIGDEVTLSLRGAHFVQEGGISTPGKSIDWELEYAQTLTVQAFREGNEIAQLDFTNVAPTPAPQSPIRKLPSVPTTTSDEFTSPAVKRLRLSDIQLNNGPLFDAGFGTLWEEAERERDRKKPRKSYGDWKTWTYTARTPSPEKDNNELDDGFDEIEATPSRASQLPATPVSPPKAQPFSVAGLPLGQLEQSSLSADDAMEDVRVVEENSVGDAINDSIVETVADDFVRDADYYDLYAGPNEYPPPELTNAFGGDTEPNTEEEEAHTEQDLVDLSTTVSNTEESRAQSEQQASQADEVADIGFARGYTSEFADGGMFDITDASFGVEGFDLTHEQHEIVQTVPGEESAIAQQPEVVMPPPTLPFLQTDIPTTSSQGLLTPVGNEPSSPTLKPLDSSTLPMPSPFPGDQDMNIASYLDRVQAVEQSKQSDPVQSQSEESENEDSYMEPSFYSSISASNAPAWGPTHESAFTDVRFTFGIDESSLSRPGTSSNVNKEFTDTNVAGLMAQAGEPTDVEGVGSSANITKTDIPQDAPLQGNAELRGIVSSSLNDIPRTSQEREESPYHNIPQDLVAPEVVIEAAPEYAGPVPEEIHIETNLPDMSAARDRSPYRGIGQEVISPEIHVEPAELNSQSNSIEQSQDSPKASFPQADESEIIHLSSGSEADSGDESVQSPANQDGQGIRVEIQDPQSDNSDGEGSLISVSDDDDDLEIADNASDDDGTKISVEDSGSEQYLTSGSEDSQRADIDEMDVDEGHQSSKSSKQQPATPAEIIDLGSDSDDEADDLQPPGELNAANDDAISTPDTTSELQAVNREHSQNMPTTVPSEEHTTHMEIDQVTPKFDKLDATSTARSNDESQMPKLEMMEYTNHAPSDALLTQDNIQEVTDLNPDIKMESIEQDMGLSLVESNDSHGYNNDDQSVAGPSDEVLIAIPEGRKLGELHHKAAPVTGPARNTRSKTKASASPALEESPASQRTTRPNKSKPAVAPTSHEATSPNLRSRSTASPMNQSQPKSPYSLRSQSKLLSPTKSVASITTPERQMHQGRMAKYSPSIPSSPFKDSFSEIDISHPDYLDLPSTSFAPSQELGTLGRYANVDHVRDSEESSLRSEHSISTAQISESQGILDIHSDPIDPSLRDPDPTSLKLPLQDRKITQEPLGQTGTTSKLDSPKRRPQSKLSSQIASNSPRRSKRLNKEVDETSQPTTKGEGEGMGRINSPSSGMAGLESLTNNNLPMTPDHTQKTLVEPHQAEFFGQQQEILPMTPRLTQATSAGLTSFTGEAGLEVSRQQPAKSPVTRSASRRKVTATGVGLGNDAAAIHSDELSASEDEATLVNYELPSTGLSTPIAYYTPLKDLRFFLNRSSQFHSSSNPDVLALVTSSSTEPKRAEKGPKHWNTTLHITDISLYPATTTIQIFRPHSTALPKADKGDAVLLRSFLVKSLNRQPSMVSGDESSWCVWRWGKPVWGKSKGTYGELLAREEVNGPAVERGEGEWKEVERLRAWWLRKVKDEMEKKEAAAVKTRSKDKEKEKEKVEE